MTRPCWTIQHFLPGGRAKLAGVDVTLEVWPDLWHVWQGESSEVPEAVAALEIIGKFVRQHLSG